MKLRLARRTARLIPAAAALLWAGAAFGDDAAPAAPTFSRDVLPILQAKCQSCHRAGGDNYTGMVAPMALTSFEETRPWAKSIATAVASRKMPPWHAAPEFAGVFHNERTMTETEIATVTRWVAAGAPPGDPADAPPPREFPDFGGWRIGEPDLIVKAPRYFVADDVRTLYANHSVTLTDEQLPASRWIKAIEWKGGSPAVHHIVGFAYAPGVAQERGKGYGLGSIAPGEEPMMFPEGYAKILVKGSTLVFSMHYDKESGPGTGVWDESLVAFKFHPPDAKIRHFVEHEAIGNAYFEIPPGVPEWTVGAGRVFEEPTTVLGVHPHMHLRGKDAVYVAYLPDGGRDTLLRVPDWDFNWQTDYGFVEPKRYPAGTRIEYTATFDNSPENPNNPDPAKAIRFGRETTDEMMLGYITYADSEERELDIEEVVRAKFSGGSAIDAHE